VVRACLDHAAKTGKPLQTGFGDEKDWQRRYSDLEQDTEVAERPRRQEADLIGRADEAGQIMNFGLEPVARRQTRGREAAGTALR